MKQKVHDIILIALFAALTAVGAFIKIPLPHIPLTLQTLMVMFAGLVLGSHRGAMSQLLYLLIGLTGIPIFAQGGGPGYIFQPSFGFLIGFIPGAYLIGKIAEGKENLSLPRALTALLCGQLIIYLFGLSYLYLNLNFIIHRPVSFYATVKIGLLVFIPGDILKIILASLVVPPIRQRLVRIQY